jgi:hypothetical protein
MSRPTCVLCGEPMLSTRNAWKEVTGLVHPRTNDRMVSRRQTGRMAHPECVAKVRAGVAVRQEALL